MLARTTDQLVSQRCRYLLLMSIQWPQKYTISSTQFRKISVTSFNLKDAVKDESVNVTFNELVCHLKNPSSYVIDVRNPEELGETGMLPGSINIPLPVLSEALDLPDHKFRHLYGVAKPVRDSNVIFSCKGGVRSNKALVLAREKGFKRACQYPGGWLGWMENQPK